MTTKTKRRAGDFDQHIGSRIRYYRLMKDVSQNDLATNIGVTFQQIQKYENGQNRVSASTLYAVAEALEVSVMHLYEGFYGETDSALTSVQSSLDDPALIGLIRDWNKIENGELKKSLLKLIKTFISAK